MKKIKKLTILICISVMIFSCKQIQNSSKETNNEPNFKVFNKSKSDLDWFKIYLLDANNQDTTLNQIEVNNSSLKVNSELPIFSVNLKKYSKTGKGYFKVYIKKLNQNVVLSQRFNNYDNYSFSDKSFPGYNTFEIVILDKNSLPSPNENKEIKLSFSKYKGETKIEGY